MKVTTAVLLILLTIPSTYILAADGKSDVEILNGGLKLDWGLPPATVNLKLNNEQFEWSPTGPERNWKYIVIHHSATTGGSVESIHREHGKRKDASGNNWLGIGYHFVIGNGKGMSDGAIEPTFRWLQQIHGAHSGKREYNGHGIGVCLIGNFEDNKPTVKQQQAITKLLRQLTAQYQLGPKSIIGHNEVKQTFCPGRNLPLQQIIKDANPGLFP